MSKVMRTIDAKSFIIGVLSAVVVCVVMGAARIKDEEHIILYFDTKNMSNRSLNGGDSGFLIPSTAAHSPFQTVKFTTIESRSDLKQK